MKLIVGLGNPGKNFIDTRHNVGFFVLDSFLQQKNWKEKFSALYCEEFIGIEKVLFVKPLTFMNLSGNAVIQFVNYYNISLEDILVIQDDMDLEFGNYKVKKNSSSGGHNGVKSIISCLHSENFSRLKIGVSHDKSIDTKDYVLGKFSKLEKEQLELKQGVFRDIIISFVCDGIDKTMNKYNTKK